MSHGPGIFQHVRRMIYMYLALLTFLVMKFSISPTGRWVTSTESALYERTGLDFLSWKGLYHTALYFATSFLTRSSDGVRLGGTFWPGGMRAPLFINAGWTSLSRQRLSSQPHHGSQELNSQVLGFWVTIGNKQGYFHASPHTTLCLTINLKCKSVSLTETKRTWTQRWCICKLSHSLIGNLHFMLNGILWRWRLCAISSSTPAACEI